MHEPLPLAQLHEAVLEFLRGRDDAVLFGAQAVNAYVSEPRMTQDIDIMSNRAAELAAELRDHLNTRFQIAVRIREIGDARGFRLFQLQKTGNRHLVDLRSVGVLPAAERIEDIQVLAPAELVTSKVVSYHQRRGSPKSGTDWRDIAMLLLAFPALKTLHGPVEDLLAAASAAPSVLSLWKDLVAQDIRIQDESDEF